MKKDSDIEAFMDRLLRGETVGPDAASEEARAIAALWAELGELKDEPAASPALVSDFRNKLDGFRAGLDAARAESSGGGRREAVPYPRWLAWLGGVGVAALLALVALMAFQMREQTSLLRRELASTRETLSLALLDEPSAAKRLAGLQAAAQIDEPSPALRQALLWTIEHDSSPNVRMAALDAVARLPREQALSLLVDVFAREESPVVQVEILRRAFELAGPEGGSALLLRFEPLAKEPRVKELLRSGNGAI